MTTFVFTVDLFDEELYRTIFSTFINRKGIHFEQTKIASTNHTTYTAYKKIKYNYYGMKYTLVFKKGFEYMLDMESIKKKLKDQNYTIKPVGNNTYEMVPDERIVEKLKTNFKSVEARKRQYETLQTTRHREEQRQMEEQRGNKRRWKEPEERRKTRRWKEPGRQTSRKRMKPKRLYNVMTLKF